MSRRSVSASAYDYVLMSVMSLQDCSLVVKYVRLCKEGGHHLSEKLCHGKALFARSVLGVLVD